MTPEERRDCAQKAAQARWKNVHEKQRVISGYEYEAFQLFEKLENDRAAIRHAIPFNGKDPDAFVSRVKALDEVYAEFTAARAFLRHEWGLA